MIVTLRRRSVQEISTEFQLGSRAAGRAVGFHLGNSDRRRLATEAASGNGNGAICIPRTGQVISRVGFGAYRINPDVPHHFDALQEAFSAGVNVIDTAAHFGDGASERAIGTFLQSEKAPRREDVCVITKAGFVTPHIALTLDRANVPATAVHRIGGQPIGHSLDVDALRAQLDSSLERLGTDYVDVFMLNTPERLLSTISENQLYDQLGRAAEYLAQEHARGRIRGFGVCSMQRKWALPAPLVRDPRFLAVEVPANLCETQFLAAPFLEDVRAARVAVFTHRLVTAINADGQPVRLASTASGAAARFGDHEDDITAALSEAFVRLQAVEEALADRVADPAVANRFVWSTILAENLDRLVANELAARVYLDRTAIPQIESDIAVLRKTLDSEEDADSRRELLTFAGEYDRVAREVSDAICAVAQRRLLDRASEWQALVSLYARGTDEWSLQRQSLGLVRAALADVQGCVLVGMRRPEYVRDLFAPSEEGVVPEERQLWDAIHASGALNHVGKFYVEEGEEDE